MAVLKERNGFDLPRTDDSIIIYAIRNVLSLSLSLSLSMKIYNGVLRTANIMRIDERSNYRYRVIIRLSNTLSRKLHARFMPAYYLRANRSR